MSKAILLFIFFGILGLVFKIWKTVSLISGFETLSPKEKRKWNKKSLSKYVGNLFLIISALYLILFGIETAYPQYAFLASKIITSLAVILGLILLIYTNISKRFRNI